MATVSGGTYENPAYTIIDPTVGVKAFQQGFQQSFNHFNAIKEEKKKEREEFEKRAQEAGAGMYEQITNAKHYGEEGEALIYGSVDEAVKYMMDNDLSPLEVARMSKSFGDTSKIFGDLAETIFIDKIPDINLDKSHPLYDDWVMLNNAFNNGTAKIDMRLDTSGKKPSFVASIDLDGDGVSDLSGDKIAGLIGHVKESQTLQTQRNALYDDNLTNAVTAINTNIKNDALQSEFGNKDLHITNSIEEQFDTKDEKELDWLYFNKVTSEYKKPDYGDIIDVEGIDDKGEKAYVSELNKYTNFLEMTESEITEIVDSVKGEVELTEEEKEIIKDITDKQTTFKKDAVTNFVKNKLVGINDAKPEPDETINERHGTGSDQMYNLYFNVHRDLEEINRKQDIILSNPRTGDEITTMKDRNVYDDKTQLNLYAAALNKYTGQDIITVDDNYALYKDSTENYNANIDVSLIDATGQNYKLRKPWPVDGNGDPKESKNLTSVEKLDLVKLPIKSQDVWKTENKNKFQLYRQDNGKIYPIFSPVTTVQGFADYVRTVKYGSNVSELQYNQTDFYTGGGDKPPGSGDKPPFTID